MNTIFILSLVMLFCSPGVSAMSRFVSLGELSNNSPVIVVASIGEERRLEAIDYERHTKADYGVITRIKVEKVVKGSVSVGDDLLLFRPTALTTVSPIYFSGERDLLFLRDVRMEAGLESKVQKRHGDEVELVGHGKHYAVNINGALYLGLDQAQAKKVKASSELLYEHLIKRDSDLVKKERNQKFLESTVKLLKIMDIQDAAEREKALSAVLTGDDEVLKRAAKYELQEIERMKRRKKN